MSQNTPNDNAQPFSDARMREQDADIQPLSPEEIKAIGEIELGPSRHEQFLNAHYKKLMWGGIALGIISGSIIAYFSHVNDEKDAAAAQVVTAMKAVGPASVALPADYDAAALTAVQADHAGTPSAATAELMEGLAKLDGADKEAGLAKLKEVAAKCDNLLIRTRALTAVASALMTDGKDDEAAAVWEQVANMGESPYRALAYMTLGDMARSAGDTEKARGYYGNAETLCPTSPLVVGKTVQMRTLLLDVDAPKPVAPASAEKADAPADNGGMEEYTPTSTGTMDGILGGGTDGTPGL